MSLIGSLPTSLTAATGALAYVALLVALWLGVLALMATFGGWNSVARDYPASGVPTVGERITIGSLLFGRGWVGLGTYRNAVTLILSPRGFELWTRTLFHFQHPGIAVPWREVRVYEKGKTFGQPFIQLTLSQGQHLRISGRAATALVHALALAAAGPER